MNKNTNLAKSDRFVNSVSVIIGGGLILSLLGCETDAQPDPVDPVDPVSALDTAVGFIGSADALLALNGFTVQAAGVSSMRGESPTPGDGAMEVSTFGSTVTYDLAGDNLRVDYNRSNTFVGGLPITYSEIHAGELGYVEGIESVFFTGNAAMPSSRWASGRKHQALLHPHVLLREVLAGRLRATEADARTTDEAGNRAVDIEDAIHPIRLWIAEDGRIVRATTLVNDVLRRDTEVEVAYDDWQAEATGLQFPVAVSVSYGGHVVHDETRSGVEVDPTVDASEFAIPAEAMPRFDAALAAWGEESYQTLQQFASLGMAQDFPQQSVEGIPMAPGIWLIVGSHNSLVIEQESSVVLVEGPNHPGRGDAILAWVAETIPGKPVSHIISTHHHTDHAAGLRDFVAAGVTVVVHADAENLYREVFDARSTVQPDSLAANPMEPTIATVAGTLTLADATNPVTAYEIATSHADDMLVVYVPFASGGGMLFQSDLFIMVPDVGGVSLDPAWSQQLLTGIETIDDGLDVSVIVGGHGAPAALTDLIQFVQ